MDPMKPTEAVAKPTALLHKVYLVNKGTNVASRVCHPLVLRSTSPFQTGVVGPRSVPNINT